MCKECEEKYKIYELTQEYYKLDEDGKRLIDEIIRYCNENNEFPKEKDLVKKNGYIARTQFYKYFNSNSFTTIYKYVHPVVEEKPYMYKCHRCKEDKLFTEEYFQKDTNSKFGLKKICRLCKDKEIKDINFNKLCEKYNITKDTLNPIVWYDKFLSLDNVKQMPKFCYTKDNIIKIIRHVMINKLLIKSKEELIDEFNTKNFQNYKLEMLIYKLGGKYKALKICFTEYNIQVDNVDRKKYINDETINVIITKWIKESNISICDILKSGLKYKLSKEMLSLIMNVFKTQLNTFIWYFDKNEILHPIYNRKITVFDFEEKPRGFWDTKENRINRIKLYCENECEESIINVINDTEKLKEWIYKYFKQENIVKHTLPYTPYNHSLYDVLIEAYPCIKENNILFKWEWHQWNKYNKQFLLTMLREVVLYRLNDIIINPICDIPKYLNMNFMDTLYPKFSKHIDRKRFEDFYEWACQSFPEYENQWDRKDFGQIVSIDGIKFDSYQEKDLYEFVKQNLLFRYIKPIGQIKGGKYTYELDDNYEYQRFCPDFVIEEIFTDNKKIKLQKPIIIEYYGMYVENHPNKIFQKYYKKTIAKEQFYKSREDIYYIGIFPEDIKNNYKGLVKKLDSFFILNFNIDIKNVA